MNRGMDLTISIVNMDSRDVTLACLESISVMNWGNLEIEIWVVDNLSTDGSVSAIKSQYPHVKQIVNTNILGFGANHNQVIKKATGRYVLVLNNDTVVERETITKMVEFLDDHHSTGISGCKIHYPDGDLQRTCGRFPRYWGEFLTLTMGPLKRNPLRYTKWRMMHDSDYNHIMEVDWISGVAMMIRADVFTKIGLFDDTITAYYDDTEFCYRMRAMTDYGIKYYPEHSVVHHHGHTMSQLKQGHARRFGFNVEGCITYFKKHHGRISGTLLQYALLISHLILLAMAAVASLLTLFQSKRLTKAFQLYRRGVAVLVGRPS